MLGMTYKHTNASRIPEEKDSDNITNAMQRKMDFKGAIGFAVMK